jgi:beta-lactamase regulating signal transducer with metallopeptidase domain
MNLWSHFSAIGLAGWLADFYLLATLLMLVAIVARRWIRQPAQRLTVHWIVAVELAVLAAVCAMPFWPRVSLRGAAAQKSAVEKAAVAEEPMPRPAPLPRTAFPRLPREVPEFDAHATPDVDQPIVPPIAPPARWSWLEMAAAAYMASAGLVVVWLIWGAVAAARTCRHAENAPNSLREELLRIVGDGCRAPRLLVSSRVKTAVALGLRRPAILLPAGLLQEGPPQAIRAILTHEWAHIRNGDLWLLALGRWLLVLLFPHPLLWWLRRAVRGDQELLADAAAAGDNRPAYAEELLRLVRKTAYPSPISASVAVGIWESSSQLSRRIAMLLDENFHVEPRASRRWRYRALGLLVILGVACSLMTFQPARFAGQSAKGDDSAVVKSGPAARPYSTAAGNAKADSRQGVPLVSTSVGSAEVESADDSIQPPVYRLHLIADPAVRKELNVTADQVRKLLAIREKSDADDAKFRKPFDEAMKNTKKLPPAELAKLARKLANERARWMMVNIKEVRKEAEEVLTPGQLAVLKEEMFRELAYSRIAEAPYSRNKGLDALKLTREQNDAVHSLGKEANDWFRQYHQAIGDKTLAILTREQKARLSEEALGPLGPNDPLESLAVRIKGEKEPYQVYSLYPYPDFTQASVRKELGLNAAQEQQVWDILGESSNLAERFARDLEKLSPDERKKLRESNGNRISNVWAYIDDPSSPEESAKKMIEERKKARVGFAEQPDMKPALALRKQFEAVLTPEQLARYQELAVRNFAAGALYGTLLPMIGASKEQQAEIERFSHDRAAEGLRLSRELGRRLLTILTPSQQAALRAEFEKELNEGETIRELPDQPPAEAKNASAESPARTSANSPAAAKGDPGSPPKTGSYTLNIASPPAAQPAPATTEVDSGDNVNFDDGTAASKQNLSAPRRYPPYCGIFFPPMQKEMNLSAEQCKRLSEVSADFWTKFKAPSKENADMTDQKMRAKYFAKVDQLARDCRQQVEAIVTPQQLEAYKKAALPLLAFEMLDRPGSRKTIGVAGGQEEKMQQIFKEYSQQLAQPPTADETKRMEQAKDAVLAALSPRQREKLRSEVEQSIRNSEESTLSYFIGTESDEPVFNLAGPAESGKRWAPMVLPFYWELTETAIAQRLGLSADQRKQLTQVEREHRGETAKLAGEIKKLPPDQRKRPEFHEKALRMLEAVRRRTEAVLTPQQLAALKDMVFRRRVFGTLADPNEEVKIGLNDQQKAAAKRINEEPANQYDRILREAARKLIGVLTPQQQDKIREVLDQQGW